MPPPHKLNPLYTPEFMVSLHHDYTQTNEPMWSIAARHGIGTRTLEKIVARENWPKRRERVREVIPAQHLLEEAEALLMSQEPVSPGTGGERPEAPAPSAVERIEKLVIGEIEIEEARHARLAGLPRPTAEAARTARTLAVLAQTLQAVRRLRMAEQLPPAQAPVTRDDEMPEDIDEFRNELARRIDAFVASREQQEASQSGTGGQT